MMSYVANTCWKLTPCEIMMKSLFAVHRLKKKLWKFSPQIDQDNNHPRVHIHHHVNGYIHRHKENVAD